MSLFWRKAVLLNEGRYTIRIYDLHVEEGVMTTRKNSHGTHCKRCTDHARPSGITA